MSNDPRPTVRDHSDQPGEALDAAKVPETIPEQPLAARAHGITAAQQAAGESLDQKLMRENRGDGAEAQHGRMGAATRGVDPEATTTPGMRLVGEDDRTGEDRRKDLVAEADMGGGHDVAPTSARPRVPLSAEADAVHPVDDDER